MKQRFLVLYAYGQGGVWAFIHARSRRDIERRFPELEIVDEPPSWMSEDEIAILEERMTFDIERPRGFLAKLAEQRARVGRDASAG